MSDLISRRALFNELFIYNGKVWPDNDIDNFPTTFKVKDIKNAIRNAPTAYDLESVIEQLEEKILKIKEILMSCIDDDSNYAVRLRTKMSAYEEIKEIVKSGATATNGKNGG